MSGQARALLCEFCDWSLWDCRCSHRDPVEAKRARRLVETRHRAAVTLATAADAHRSRWVAEACLDALRVLEGTTR